MNPYTRALTDDRHLAVMKNAPNIEMRLARPSDADYIYSLRIDPRYNQHLSAAPQSVAAQAQFLENYVKREEAGQEYYFVIKNKSSGKDCGVVRIYDLREDSFCWGSWILDTEKPRMAALESALFIYEFGFGVLGFGASHFEVRKENTRVISFHERFGAQRISEDENDVFFTLSQEDLRAKLPQLTETASYTPVYLSL
jgi:RimJ/RimL family protein N-acetyltransferase